MRRQRSITEPSYFVLAALLDGRLRLTAGTLYGALDRLADQQLVTVVGHEQVAGRTRRYYQLTDRGIHALKQEAARMEQAARIVTGRHDLPADGPQPA